MIRVLLMCLFIASSNHDIHFTKSTFDYNNETKTLQVVMNVFTDDLELAIERSHEGLDLEIGAENQHVKTDSLIADYVLNHIMFTNNSHKIEFDFIGFEYDYDICYLYLESEQFTVKNCSTNSFMVKMFMEVYEDQENVCEFHFPYWDTEFIFTNRMTSLYRDCD